MKSMRGRMTMMIVLVVLGSSVLLSFTSYQRAKRDLIRQLEENYAVAAQKYALELSSWVSTNATIIDTMAAEIAVNDISTKSYDEFHAYLKHSNELLNKNGYVYDVYFTYPDNYMVCASDFVADGTVDFVHEREWYTTSALTGELFFSTPYLDSDTKKPIITISKAVYSQDKLLGVLAADIFVDVLVGMINDAEVEANSYAFLVDQNMRMIVHPNAAYGYEDIPRKVMEVPDAPYGDLIESIQNGTNEIVLVDDYDGVKRRISHSRMTNTGWYVCIATSEDELYKGFSSLIRGFVITTIMSIGVGAVIAIVFARMIYKMSRREQEYNERMLVLEKQAADEASEAKSRFLADMSHEIRTPINAIIGMNEMILRESDSASILGYSRNIKQSGHNLLQLVNGILDFSKIEDGKMEIVPVKYSVNSQLSYIINSIAGRAATKGLKMIYRIDPGIPSELYGDDTRINQILMNLLTNAVKYTEKGSVTLSIREKDRTANGVRSLLYYEVKDTGIGIKESDMPKLFESFERLDVVKNRNIEGTGLGMTITRKLLDLMGGSLSVESVYGSGSTFSFELWQRIEDEKPLGDFKAADPIADTGESYRETFHADGARVLVVDDTLLNVEVVGNLLKKTGVIIDKAYSGPESIELARHNEYDVILMDQRMPEMDGSEAMKAIRELPEGLNAKTPMICLTADVIVGAKERYLDMGFDDYLTKPVDGTALERMLTRYIPVSKIEKIRMSLAPSGGSAREAEKEKMKALKETGVDTTVGMQFCGNDEELYRSILTTFASEEPSKSANIRDSYDRKDWDKYGVYIHSLKSSSKTIGAITLYELAASLEAAAKNGDTETIRNGHQKALDMYSELVVAIKDEIGHEIADETMHDDVFEFAPE